MELLELHEGLCMLFESGNLSENIMSAHLCILCESRMDILSCMKIPMTKERKSTSRDSPEIGKILVMFNFLQDKVFVAIEKYHPRTFRVKNHPVMRNRVIK